MKIPIIWKSYHPEINSKNFWDLQMLKETFESTFWNPINNYEYIHFDSYPDDWSKYKEMGINGAVVIIPARYHVNEVDQINEDINKMDWVLLILAGEEEAQFPVEKIKHNNAKVWLMTPKKGRVYNNVDRYIGIGYTPKTKEKLTELQDLYDTKDKNWFFSGQITHSRREDLAKILETTVNGELVKSKSFTGGLEYPIYYGKMMTAKVLPCPSGPETPDTFRIYEALEAGAVPIADGISNKNNIEGYWNLLFGNEIPFPVVTEWTDDVKGLIQYHVDVYPRSNNRIFAWWQQYKRNFVYNLIEDINNLTKTKVNNYTPKDQITVLIPTSPIKSHPDTRILEETISTVRSKLPDSEIIIMFDGIREEQEDRKANYEEYIRRILKKCNYEWKNVLPLIFDKHTHQAGMTRKALTMVKTSCILFVEHDTPITPDFDFDWMPMVKTIVEGDANLIRFHFESHILPEHKHMMLDEEPQYINGIRMMKTSQWSQRPHLASADFYRKILDTYFSHDAITMIEDRMHGILESAYRDRYKVGWNEFKVWMYTPEGNIKRSYHIDGRETDSKFVDKFTF